MRYRILRMLFTSLLASGLLFATALTAPIFASDEQVSVEKIDERIATMREAWEVPGLAVAIVKDGKVILSKGYGVRELGKPDPVDGDTLFAIASNTKAFTAAGLAILAEEKKLNWKDPVQNHLPYFQLYDPWVSAEMRIDDLVCHRSGLGTFSGDLLWWGTPWSPEEVIRRTKHLKPEGSFRAHYGYSNLMFLAAGEVIAKASGSSWSDFIKSRILQPLDMQRTVTSITVLPTTENVATPHKSELDSVHPIPWYNWDTMAAAGGIISSSNDMAKWLRVQLDRGRIDDSNRLFSESSSHLMWSPHTVIPVSAAARQRIPSTHFRSYGLGWVLHDYKGRMVVSHGGGYDGMYSHVALVPDENLGIVVLTNSMTGISTPIANHIIDDYLGGESRDWSSEGLERDKSGRKDFYDRIQKTIARKAENTKPSALPDAYAGTYTGKLYGDADVTVENDRLVLSLKANPDLVADLEHLHYDTFVIHWRKKFAWFAEGTAQFIMDANGKFQEIRLDVPNDDLWFYELELKR